MNTRRQTVISRAMRFPMQIVVERYARDYETTLEFAQRLERELKRYLALAALHPRRRYGMAGPVDGLWHTFIQFTRLYARFCDRVAGQFLHHTPGDIEDDSELEQFEQDYGNLFRDYEALFGERPPDSIWPSLEMLCQRSEDEAVLTPQ
jgi:hypothetical protein